jgi:hypothetical protein
MMVEPFANSFTIRFTTRSTQPTIALNTPSSTRLKVDHQSNI